MKKYILLFFLFTWSSNLFSQNKTWEKFINMINEDKTTYQEVKSLIDQNGRQEALHKPKTYL